MIDVIQMLKLGKLVQLDKINNSARYDQLHKLHNQAKLFTLVK